MTSFSIRLRSPANRQALIFISLAAGILILGFSPLFLRWADAPGTISSFYRMAIAAAVMAFPFFYRLTTDRCQLSRSGVRYAVLGGIFFAGDLSLWSTGVVLSGATIPTLMSNVAPLFVGIGAWLFYKEQQTRLFWLGLFLALSGSILILRQDLSSSPEIGLGTVLGLLSALFYGSYYLATQGGRASLDTISYFWITAASSSLVLWIVNLVLGEKLTGYDIPTNLNFLAMAVIVQIAGWLVINFAQGFLPASIVAPTLLMQPLVTGIFSWFLLGESFTGWHLSGGIGVLAGVLLVHLSRSAKRDLEPPWDPVE